MTPTNAQLRKDAPRLITMHANLIKPGAALWRKAEAERRFKRKHFFALESEQRWVAELCIKHTCAVFRCGHAAIMCKYRLKCFTGPRHIAMTVTYELSGLSTIALGKLFNRTRHMILHAQRRVNSDDGLREQADKVVKAVKKELRRK